MLGPVKEESLPFAGDVPKTRADRIYETITLLKTGKKQRE
jgi:hypothetical protein